MNTLELLEKTIVTKSEIEKFSLLMDKFLNLRQSEVRNYVYFSFDTITQAFEIEDNSVLVSHDYLLIIAEFFAILDIPLLKISEYFEIEAQSLMMLQQTVSNFKNSKIIKDDFYYEIGISIFNKFEDFFNELFEKFKVYKRLKCLNLE